MRSSSPPLRARDRVPAIVLVFLLTLLTTLAARSQQRLTILSPTNGAVDVSTHTDITIRATTPIVRYSVTQNWPDADAQAWRPEEPTVLLIDDAVASTTPRFRWKHHCIHGNVVFDDPWTFRYIPSIPLQPRKTYRLLVLNVGVMIQGQTTIVPNLESTFRTVAPVVSLAASTFDSIRVITCRRPVYFRFRDVRPEDVAMASNSAWIIDRTEDLHNGGDPTYPVERRVFLNGDTLTLEITPITTWPVGGAIHGICQLGTITGDDRQDKVASLPVRRGGRVQIQTRSVDGRPVPDFVDSALSIGPYVAVSGVDLPLRSPEWFDDAWRFVRWESRDVTIAHPEKPSTDVTFSCDLMLPVFQITAIVERIDSLAVVVKGAEGGTLIVRAPDGTSLVELAEDEEDTIVISDEQPEVYLHATPLAGYQMASWNAVGQTFHGSATAVVSLGAGAVRLAIAQGPSIGYGNPIVPVFNPLGGMSEEYKLKGHIVNVDTDPGFVEEDAGVFTTEREFEFGASEERTVCVRTNECWDIVATFITRRGTFEDLPNPARQLCITDVMLNPVNDVQFHVQRRPVRLRVERTLVKDDDPNESDPLNRLHPETTVIVEVRKRDRHGVSRWVALNGKACSQDPLLRWTTYDVRCGDELRLRILSSEMRGEEWRFWSDATNYVAPGDERVYERERQYTFIVDDDLALFDAGDCLGAPLGEKEIRMRACWRKTFGIDAIGMRLRLQQSESKADDVFRLKWLDPIVYHDELADEVDGGRQIEYIPYHGTKISVRFTAPLDIRTVSAGGMKLWSYSNVLVNDYATKDLDFDVTSGDLANITYQPLDGTPITTVEFAANDPTTSPRKQALHYGGVDVWVGTGIKSLRGVPLQSAATFVCQSLEKTGVAVNLEEGDWGYDGDWDFIWDNHGELYHVVYGAALESSDVSMTSAFRRIPRCDEQRKPVPDNCTVEWDDSDPAYRFGGEELFFEPYWLADHTALWTRIASYDEDCRSDDNCLVNNVSAILKEVRERLESYEADEEDKTPESLRDWETILPEVISLGARLIDGLLPIEDQDYFLGAGSVVLGGGTLWGARTQTPPYTTASSDNATYKFKTRLYPRKAVIR